MSGGHFDYNQYRINDIVDQIEKLIAGNNKIDQWGYARNYSVETIAKFQKAVEILKIAESMAQRIDWLVSGDDGEETFHKRWVEEGCDSLNF